MYHSMFHSWEGSLWVIEQSIILSLTLPTNTYSVLLLTDIYDVYVHMYACTPI